MPASNGRRGHQDRGQCPADDRPPSAAGDASPAARDQPAATFMLRGSRSLDEPYAKAMRQRQVWVEPLFAEAKGWHGLRRFRLRGLEQVNGEALLIAAGQNLKRLLSQWGWGRRPFPTGAAGGGLPALPCLPTFAPWPTPP